MEKFHSRLQDPFSLVLFGQTKFTNERKFDLVFHISYASLFQFARLLRFCFFDRSYAAVASPFFARGNSRDGTTDLSRTDNGYLIFLFQKVSAVPRTRSAFTLGEAICDDIPRILRDGLEERRHGKPVARRRPRVARSFSRFRSRRPPRIVQPDSGRGRCSLSKR